MYDYLSKFDNCLEGTIPYCTGACPFNMEILNFMEKARRGSAKASFNVYRNAVGFPQDSQSYMSPSVPRRMPQKGSRRSVADV